MTSAPTIIKLNAQTAGPFNQNQNIVDFEIPSGMLVSLRDSYISFNCVITTTEKGDSATAANGQGIYPVNMRWASAPNLKVPNISLVRDASISCERRGQIENIRHLDQLKTNLGYYSESIAAQASNKYLDMCPFRENLDAAAQKSSIFRELQKNGDAPSRNLTIAPIQIALEDMFDFCKTDEFDTSRAGRTTIRTRLNIDKLEAVATTDPTIAMNGQGLKMEGVATTGVASSELVTSASYKSLDQIPFHVGQRIQVAAAVDGGTAIDKSILIKSISWSQENDGKISMATSGNWIEAAQSTGTVSDIVVSFPSGGNSPDVSFVIDYAEIVLKEVSQPKGYDEINFNTFGTEQTNGNGLTAYRNIFNLEPEATNILVVFPQAANELLSKSGAADSSYNLRLNNEDLTDNREVVFGTALDKDRVNIGLTNMGVKPRNLHQNGGDTRVISGNRYTDTDLETRIIAAPMRVTTQQKLLQVSVDDTGGTNAVTLFSELPRVFSY